MCLQPPHIAGTQANEVMCAPWSPCVHHGHHVCTMVTAHHRPAASASASATTPTATTTQVWQRSRSRRCECLSGEMVLCVCRRALWQDAFAAGEGGEAAAGGAAAAARPADPWKRFAWTVVRPRMRRLYTGEPQRLVIESPWSLFTRDFQRLCHPLRLNHQPLWTQGAGPATAGRPPGAPVQRW
jgi:hypothetical protein